MIREFEYNGKPRKVLVFHQNGVTFDGIELNALEESEQQECIDFFKDLEPTDFGVVQEKREGANPTWFKWKRFSEASVKELKKDNEN